jgi:hypothetical protein
LGYQYYPKDTKPGGGIWFESQLSFVRYSLIPTVGVTPGITFRLNKALRLDLGLDIEYQESLEKPPFSQSQFDTSYGGPVVRLKYQISDQLALQLGGKVIYVLKANITTLESLETLIDHTYTLVLSPEISWGETDRFGLRAKLDFYQLGKTAIASKEFAFATDRQNVMKWTLMAKYPIQRFELRFSYSLVTGVSDPLELFYQAPFISTDYLLSKQVGALELAWRF